MSKQERIIEKDYNLVVFKVPEWEEEDLLSDHWLRLEEISGKVLSRKDMMRLVNKETKDNLKKEIENTKCKDKL